MTIAAEWNIDFTNLIISHVDGNLPFDTNSGTEPLVGDYIKGGTSGAVGKVLSRDIGASGNIELTRVTGVWAENETIEVLDSLPFDTVLADGFVVGDTIEDTAVGDSEITVDAVEYTGLTGTIYGTHTGPSFGAETLQVTTATGTTVASATGAETAGGSFTGALVNSGDANIGIVPVSITRIVNYDTGTLVIPRFATIADDTTGATGQVQNVIGVTATGSIRIVDVTGGTFTDGNGLDLQDNIYYDGQAGGQKFRVGDTVLGAGGATGKIIALDETVPGTSGDFTVLNLTSGPFVNNETISVGGVTIANVEAAAGDQAAFIKQVALINGTEFTGQLASQGGIYGTASLSLNGVRDLNSLYTYLQDTFDELGALDDEVPMTAQVKLQQYTLINNWSLPDLSYRYLQSGSVQDSALANIWTNYNTIGSVAGIIDTGYLATAVPIPQIYMEQNGSVIDTFWLSAHIDILVKVTSNSLPSLGNGDITDGVSINGGTVTIFSRRYGDTYDHFETTTIAGVAPIPLATAADINNATGTHSFDTDSTTGYAVGEEFVDDTDPTKRGVVTALDTGPTGLSYIFTGTTQFINTDVIVNQVSTSLATLSSTISSEVDGFGTQVVVATVNGTQAYSAVSSTLIEGELISQSSTGAQAIMMSDTGSAIILGNQDLDAAGAIIEFEATSVVTALTSTETITFSAGSHTSVATIDRDIDDGGGVQPFNSVIYMNRDAIGGEGETLGNMYEWIKYRTRGLTVGGLGEQTGEPAYDLLGAPGVNESGVQGRIYITLNTTYPLSKASPFGTFAGGTFFGATGVFIQDMNSADIRNYQLIDNNGVLRSPPNLQTLTAAGLVTGDRVAVFRRPNATAGSGIETTEYTLDSAASTFNQTTSTLIRVQAAIATDTPAAGVVRAKITSTGLFNSYSYISFTGQEFTLGATIGIDLDSGEDSFVPLIEAEATGTTESVNLKYQADIPLLARVRKKGILPFEVEGTFGSAGATVTAIRTTDTIVD